MEDPSNSHKSESLCKVCGDKASGKHYGVASCDGCRGFFKRSIRRNLEYICKENGRCIVDVTRRNQCQACRFKKCLQVNMKRDAVQHERAPRSTQPTLHQYSLGMGSRFRNLHPPMFASIPFHLQHSGLMDSTSLAPTNHPYLSSQTGLLYPGMFGSFSKPPGFLHSGLSVPSLSSQFFKHNVNVKDDEVVTSTEEVSPEKCNEENRLNPSPVTTEKSLDLPLPESCQSMTHLSTSTTSSSTNRRLDLTAASLNLFPAENIYDTSTKLLFLAVKWTRTIPSFLQLSYRDQAILLEESWNDLFVLTAAQWMLPVDEVVLVNSAIAPSSRHSYLQEDARKLRDVVNRLNLLRVDHTEYACLKALVLFKAECRGLCEPNHIELLQDQTHVMLHEYCTQRQSHHKGRFGKLLLTLPAVQAVSRQSLEELLFRQTVGDVTIDRLLTELSKINNT